MNWNNMQVRKAKHKPARQSPKSWLQIRDQVINTFVRVLERNPKVVIRKTHSVLTSNPPSTMDICFQDKKYEFSVVVNADQVLVLVYVVDQTPARFFEYRCPVSHMGKIRKTALILMTKMKMAPFYEVHSS